MKTIFFSLLSVLSIAPAFINAIVPPGGSSPEFYLVASSQSSSSNLNPLRTSGGSNGGTSLTGSSPIGIFYMYQGELARLDNSNPIRPYVSAIPTGGGCSTYGPLAFGSGSNKCASYGGFYIQSNQENSQLGAKVVHNSGAFYDCGSNGVWYKEAAGDGGQTCTQVDLYTVPVV